MSAPPRYAGVAVYIAELKTYLKQNNITYGDLARALGMDERSQVSRWMNGRVDPRPETIAKIDKAVAKILKGRTSAHGPR